MSGGEPSPISELARSAAATIADAALRRVEEPGRGVRVEDYLTTLAALTGEAAFVAAGAVDIEQSDFPPGSPVFGDQVNHVLSGDRMDLAAVPVDSVLGILAGELVPGILPVDDFGSIEDLYRYVAANVGHAAWGSVTVSVPEANRPRVVPLQVACELRPVVDAALTQSALPGDQRHVPCAVALSDAIKQVKDAIDPRIALRLSLEVAFGMAKRIPMSRRAFDAATRGDCRSEGSQSAG